MKQIHGERISSQVLQGASSTHGLEPRLQSSEGKTAAPTTRGWAEETGTCIAHLITVAWKSRMTPP
jgi:hypothetical protein